MTLASTPILTAVYPASAMKTVTGLWFYLIAFSGFWLGSLAGALALAVVARRRSARSHSPGSHKHATAGLFVSLPLLVCYTGVVVFWVITMMA